VRDPALHVRVCAEVRAWVESSGWTVDGIVESPITGPEGNVEFLIVARRGEVRPAALHTPDAAANIVTAAESESR
jgi:23S rRNA (cytidine1920-2'-O)/16S rRNA (cytidine1409-2'-O)-methyltransferase